MFILIVVFNFYFVVLWLFRFLENLVRLYIDMWKHERWFQVLFGGRTFENYDTQLEKIV